MKSNSQYKLNPKFAWIFGSSNQILLFQKEKPRTIHLEGVDAIVWRCVWQGFSPQICAQITNGNGDQITNALDQLLETELIMEDY